MTKYEVGRLPKKLEKIALGACFLGSGGGGGLETSFKYIERYFSKFRKGQKIRDLQITDLKDSTAGESGIVVAYMGAPQKMGDIKCPDAVCEGIKKFMKDKGIARIDYIIPAEVGPGSTITACLTAHKMGIPVLNVDGAGRAVPTLDLITYTTNANASVNPTILCSEKKAISGDPHPRYHQITLEISDDTGPGAASKMESFARPVLNMAEFDQKAGLVMWYFSDVTKLRDTNASVLGTLTFCQILGDAIQSKPKKKGVFPDIEKLFSGNPIYPFIKKLCHGKLDCATTSTVGGFDVGIITIKGDSEHFYKIIFQNESLILWDSGSAKPLITAPDLISYLIEDSQGQYVFTNGDIMHGGALKKDLVGKEIVVYGIAAPKALRDPESDMIKRYMSVLNTLGYYGKYEPLKK